jgi:cytochrome P450
MTATLDVSNWDPADPTFRADPYPWYHALREQTPVHLHPAVGYVLSRYADIDSVLRDDRFSVSTPSPWREVIAEHAAPALRMLGERSLLFIDPIAHTRVRGLVAKAFTARRLALLRPHLERTIDALLDRLDNRREFDLLVEIAEPLPILTITHLLGVPDADWSQLHGWTTAITAFNELPIDFNALPGANAAAAEFNAYCNTLIDQRRAAPGDDLVSALIAAEDDGRRLDHDEVVAMLILLLMAGHDTTKSLISSGMRELLRHPDQAALLRNDPALVGAAIEELLRYESPLHVASGGGRWTKHPITLHDVTIEPGVPVRLLLGSANRDPDVFEHPDTLDLRRGPRPHLAFGKGIHFCLGAALGRLEGQVVIPKILARFPDLELTSDDLDWRPSFVTRQLATLPVLRTGTVASAQGGSRS